MRGWGLKDQRSRDKKGIAKERKSEKQAQRTRHKNYKIITINIVFSEKKKGKLEFPVARPQTWKDKCG